MKNRKSVQDVLNQLKKLKAMKSPLYYSVINDLEEMANGGDAGTVREDIYKGYPDSFFKEVLSKLDQDN